MFIGRQPIYDANLDLVAYELLFRSGEQNAACVVDGDAATFTVMLNALVEIGLHRLVGDKAAFINLTRNSVLCEYASFFPQDQVVMEVLEHVEVDDELSELVQRYRENGYRVALDDFVYRPGLEPLIEQANIIKVDVQAVDRQVICEYVNRYDHIELLAEKVETMEDYEFCKSLGFSYFQGYFLERPQVLRVSHVPICQQSILKLLTDLHRPDVTQRELAETVSMDPSLSYRLLRTAGGRAGLNAVSSVEDAVRLVGLEALKRWVTLLAIGGSSDMPHEYLVEGMSRGFACRELARKLGVKDAGSFQLAGLLSVVPEFLDVPMHKVLRPLDLRDDLMDGLMGAGLMGEVVSDITHIRSGRQLTDGASAQLSIIEDANRVGSELARNARIELGI